MKRDELVSFLDAQFAELKCADHSNNGLQVEGRAEVHSVAFAVDGCLKTFEDAVKLGADLVFCHHGISWGGGIKRFTGIYAARLKTLLENGVSLYGMHLPLDAHPVIGNNAVLADILGISPADRAGFSFYDGMLIGCGGPLKRAATARQLATLLDERLQTQCRVFDFAGRKLKRVAIVSGGGAFSIEDAAAQGYDALLTGEIGHANYNYAKELGLSVIAGGHYATETTGPMALMRLVSQTFPKLRCFFIDNPTGL